MGLFAKLRTATVQSSDDENLNGWRVKECHCNVLAYRGISEEGFPIAFSLVQPRIFARSKWNVYQYRASTPLTMSKAQSVTGTSFGAGNQAGVPNVRGIGQSIPPHCRYGIPVRSSPFTQI